MLVAATEGTDDLRFDTREEFLTSSGIFEFSLLIVAFGLGWIFSVSPTEYADWNIRAIGYGLLSAVPLFFIFLGIEQLPLPSVQKVQQTVLNTLGRYLAECSHAELAMLAILAGVGEEVLFRGFMMVWLESFLNYEWSWVISSMAFGIVHAVTWTYAIFASLAGLYFGWLFDATGERNLLAPIASHAFYDYLAFLVIVRDAKREGLAMHPEPPEESFKW
ncbi:MAG: CPBP family intramembrane metalloprotease [Planctomycetaceae bacterium]|nr:CPBP family intramembrane metalloprotease [Planctomycetaceae bacterium]